MARIIQEQVIKGCCYHISNGRTYWPVDASITLDAYKEVCRQAYGDLRGVKFGIDRDKVRTFLVELGHDDA